MNEFSLFPWVNWLIDQGPWAAAVIFLALDFGVLTAMNLYDIVVNCKGNTHARPRGHLSFWMVVFVDTLILPAIGFSTVAFWQMAVEMGKGINPVVSSAVDIIGVVIGIVVGAGLVLSNRGSSYEDWTIVGGRLNWAGIWHTGCMIFFVSYVASFFAKGLVVGWGSEDLMAWYRLFAMLSLSVGATMTADVMLNTKPQLWPSTLITKFLFGRAVNW